jgi:hypothetical protein
LVMVSSSTSPLLSCPMNPFFCIPYRAPGGRARGPLPLLEGALFIQADMVW